MGSTRNAVMQLQKVLERDPKNKEAQKDVSAILKYLKVSLTLSVPSSKSTFSQPS